MENPKPISAAHKAFARALVSLAREHGAGVLNVDFRLSSSRSFRERKDDWTVVKLGWSEGRHGSEESISLRAEAYETIPEKAPA